MAYQMIKDKHSTEAYIERLEDYHHTFQEHHKAIMAMRGMSSEHDYLKKKTPMKDKDACYVTKADFKRYRLLLLKKRNLLLVTL